MLPQAPHRQSKRFDFYSPAQSRNNICEINLIYYWKNTLILSFRNI